MRIIIPMAGRGSRLRPHTLTVPKPLLPIAGKPIVQRLVEALAKGYGETIDEIAFIIGDFGEQVKKDLLEIAEGLGAKGHVYTQDQPLGTAHAILCAADSLSGNCIVAFADTLFRADFNFNKEEDGIIWAKRVEDPSAYGVLQLDKEGYITDFVEKPETFISDLAIVGIYYFKDGDYLKKQLQYLIDNDIKDKGEYQLTNALENMKQQGTKFKPGEIEEWLDCGNKKAVVHTNQRILEFTKNEPQVAPSAQIDKATIIPPCYIGKGAIISNAVVGPYVSIGDNTKVENAVISNTLIQNDSVIKDAIIENSMIGNLVEFTGQKFDLSLGDYSKQ